MYENQKIHVQINTMQIHHKFHNYNIDTIEYYLNCKQFNNYNFKFHR